MPRWDAQAEERLRTAAIELFLELGYDNVTVAQIADRAGLNRRTFSRYFADKRDVLFSGSEQLPGLLADALRRTDPELTPFAALLTALADVGAVLGSQVAPLAAQRREVIARSPELQERGRTKFAAVADALAAQLVARGGCPGQLHAARRCRGRDLPNGLQPLGRRPGRRGPLRTPARGRR